MVQVKTKNTVEFLPLVSCCINKYKRSSVDFCGTLASCSLGEEIFGIALAAFTFSLKTEFNVKGSVHLIKHIMKSEWIQLCGWQLLCASLNNIGVLLYRDKQLKEASKSIKLCCSTSWTYVIHLCRTSTTEISSDSNLLGTGIANSVNETIAKTIFFVDVVNQCGNKKVKKIIMESLKDWYPLVPAPLVKQ